MLVAGCSPATPALSGRAGSCPLGTLPGALAAPRAPCLALARARSRGQHAAQRLSPPIRLAVGSLRSRPLSAHLARSQEPQQWVPRRTASTTHQDAGFLVAQTHRLRALSKALSEKDSGLARTRFSNLLRFFRVFAKIVFARCLKRFAVPKSPGCRTCTAPQIRVREAPARSAFPPRSGGLRCGLSALRRPIFK